MIVGVLSNARAAHPLTENLSAFGYHLIWGWSTGTLFLFGIMVGAVASQDLGRRPGGRAIANHAAMGSSKAAATDIPFWTAKEILPAGVRRAARRTEMSAAYSTWESEGGAAERGTTDGEVESGPRVPRVH
jgi:hypothetical protein